MIVYKPEKVFFAMCIYKFTLDTGFYYYGATTNFGNRISMHLRKNAAHTTEKVKNAMDKAKSIKFEIVRFVNDKKKLSEIETYYLSRHVGREKCLNKNPTSCLWDDKKRTKKPTGVKFRMAIIQYDLQMNTINRFNSAYEAAELTGLSRSSISKNARNENKTCKGYIFKFERIIS